MRRRVLGTGGSRGIGRAIALSLAQQGFDVVVNYHASTAAAEDVVAAIAALGARTYALRFDVARRDECVAILAADL